MAPGFTSEYIHFFLATGLRASPLDTGDEEDLGAPIPYTRGEIEAAVADGTIEDAKTLVALQLYELHTRREATAGS